MAPGLQLCPFASGIALVLPNGSCICPVTMDLIICTVLFLHTPDTMPIFINFAATAAVYHTLQPVGYADGKWYLNYL